METFPTEPHPRVGSKESTVNPIIKSESDGNYTKTRRITTKSRKKFELNYNALTMPEYQILEDFFNANQGMPFLFTAPNSTVYECIFVQDELPKDYVNSFVVNTSIKIEEC
jgi:hypothetical protein